MQDDIVDVNLLFVVDGVRLSRKKRNSTIETEGLPQLKLVCEIVDPDKVSTPES
jgi:predicted peroxiredoxin